MKSFFNLELSDSEFASNYWIGHAYHSPYLNEVITHLKDGKPVCFAHFKGKTRCLKEDMEHPNFMSSKQGVVMDNKIHYHSVSGREIILSRDGIEIQIMKSASHKASWDKPQSNDWEDFELEMLSSQKYSY